MIDRRVVVLMILAVFLVACAGIYTYYCQLHPETKGTVIVK